jgi:molybdenum cofactor cytidylyltransferase
MTDTDFPVVSPPFDQRGEEPTVTGIILAAGTSSRFGSENKLLVPVDGVPLVCRSVAPFVDVLDQVIVVVGHEAPAIEDAVGQFPVTCVSNPSYEDGQASSVRRGLEAVSDSADGVIYGLADMPDIRSETIARLCDAFAAGAGDPVAAAFDRRRGNPVLFGRQYFEEIYGVTGDVGARTVLDSAPGTVLVETGDPGVRRDIDSPSDIQTE